MQCRAQWLHALRLISVTRGNARAHGDHRITQRRVRLQRALEGRVVRQVALVGDDQPGEPRALRGAQVAIEHEKVRSRNRGEHDAKLGEVGGEWFAASAQCAAAKEGGSRQGAGYEHFALVEITFYLITTDDFELPAEGSRLVLCANCVT